jgi:rhamnosyltransferase
MKIYSIIVCFNPDVDQLIKLCSDLTCQKSKVVIVDNSFNSSLTGIVNDNIELIQLGDNLGIAKAQNIGIQFAIKQNADIFVFFDQDSEIENGFLQNLTAPFSLSSALVTTPIFFDKSKEFRFPSYRLTKFGLLKKVIDTYGDYNVDIIISSGSATNKKTIELVGLMNEDYFIDFVDIEWSLRCKSKNVPIKVISNAKMIHAIGDKSIDFKIIRLFVHSPVRTYYKIRNSFLFFRNKNVPVLLGIKEITSALIHNFIILFFVNDKAKYFRNYCEGVFDGIFGKVGKKKNS